MSRAHNRIGVEVNSSIEMGQELTFLMNTARDEVMQLAVSCMISNSPFTARISISRAI